MERASLVLPADHRFFLLLFLTAQELLHVSLDGQQLRHLVPRLAVSHIGIIGFGVIDDVRFQHDDLRHTLLHSLDFIG